MAGPNKTGFDEATCLEVARQVKSLVEDGVQVAIVTGGGNFWRGRTSETIDRTKADQIGMLATVMNCVYVSDIFRYVGLKTSVMTPFVCGAFTELFSKDKAVKALEAGEVVFFAGGTGHPYFSTDTATVLRAIEIEADVILLAKAVDGVNKRLGVIDLAAAVLCMENHMPMMIFGLNEKNSIIDTAMGTTAGTLVEA